MSRALLVVTGETGVGKDYLVDRSNIPPHAINRANWGDIFSSIVNEDKDRLSHETYRPGESATEAIQQLVCQRVLDLQPGIITSHPVKIIDGIEYVNWGIESQLSPQRYFLVQAPAELIVERVVERNASGARKSKVLSVAELEEIQGRKLELTKKLAAHVGADITVFRNEGDECEASIEVLKTAIKDLSLKSEEQ